MLAELNRLNMVFSAASGLNWSTASSTRPSISARATRVGQHFEQLLNWIVAFDAKF